MRRFFTAGALMAAVLLAAATAASAAVPSPSYQLGGFGFGTSFIGTGIGSTGDRAAWQASMIMNAAGALTGTFSLRSNGQQETGTFSGGLATAASTAAGCGRQQVSVNATVATADGPMTLTATVTRFRFLFRGTCTVLASTLQGTIAAAPASDPGDGTGQL